MAYIYEISSDKDSDFTTGITAGAGEEENITGLKSNRILIHGVSLLTKDVAKAWDIVFFHQDSFGDTDADADDFGSKVPFSITDGDKIGSAASVYFYKNLPTPIPYIDEDGSNELHITLVNRSGTTKSATTSGNVRIKVQYSIQHDTY